MFLQYLQYGSKGRKLVECRNKNGGIIYFSFSPIGEIPDDVGKKVLEKYSAEFKEVEDSSPPNNRLLCDQCDYIGSNIKAITMHKSIKEKKK
jgi:hypothetical protein